MAITPTHGKNGQSTKKSSFPGSIQKVPWPWRISHAPANFPNAAGFTRSSKLWVTTVPVPKATITASGNRMRSAIAIIDHPSDHSTPLNRNGNVDVQANATIVKFRNINHDPRVQKNLLTCWTVLPRESDKYPPVPARRKNTGAQKCVIHRVKKSAPVVCERSSGAYPAPLKKPRVWSKAIRITAAPRSKSTQYNRDRSTAGRRSRKSSATGMSIAGPGGAVLETVLLIDKALLDLVVLHCWLSPAIAMKTAKMRFTLREYEKARKRGLSQRELAASQ